jgi:hypothetical protein
MVTSGRAATVSCETIDVAWMPVTTFKMALLSIIHTSIHRLPFLMMLRHSYHVHILDGLEWHFCLEDLQSTYACRDSLEMHWKSLRSSLKSAKQSWAVLARGQAWGKSA